VKIIVLGIVVVLRDITERIRMEEQNRYNSVLVENISDAILSTDKDFRIKTWNKPLKIFMVIKLRR
jgi:PAS domain-containing protein